MNSSVEYLIKLIDENLEIEGDIINHFKSRKHLQEIFNSVLSKNGLDNLKLFKEQLLNKDNNKVLISFTYLTYFVDFDMLSLYQIYEIILYIFKINYKIYKANEHTKVLDFETFKRIKFDSIPKSFIDSLKDAEDLTNFVSRYDELSDEEKVYFKEIMEKQSLFVVPISEYFYGYENIQKILINKEEPLDYFNIKKLLASFDNIQVPDVVLACLAKILRDKMYQNRKHENASVQDFVKFIRNGGALECAEKAMYDRFKDMKKKANSALFSSTLEKANLSYAVTREKIEFQNNLSDFRNDITVYLNYVEDFLFLEPEELSKARICLSKLNFFITYLISSPLSDDKKVEVLMYVINKNMSMNELNERGENGHYVLYDFGNDYKFNSVSRDGYINFIISGRIIDLLYDRDFKPENETEQLIYKEFMNEKDKNKFYDRIDEYALAMHKIKEKYIDARDIFSEDDIEQIIKYSEIIICSSKFSPIMEKVLRKELDKRNKKETQSVPVIAPYQKNPTVKKEEKTKEKVLSEQEWRALKKELKKLYNPHSLEFIKNLTYDEMIYVASLMFKLNYPVDEIKNFIRLSYMKYDYEKEYNNIIEKYNDLKNKVLFYFGSKKIGEIEEYITEYQKSFGEDKKFWEEEIKRLINSLYYPDTFEYELSLARA